MLQLLDIHLKRGSKELFEGLDFIVHGGQRVGLVGRNGCGKSTLFLVIRERLLPESGEIKVPGNWRIAWMAQETDADATSALDWVMDGDAELRRAQRAIARAEASGDDHALAEAHARLENLDGYTAEARAGALLHGLGFDGGDFTRPVSGFSGGWRIRLNLARTLMAPAELLLLDEPTNHLDVDATLWLERWLRRFAGTAIIISHDRDFLDGVTTHIAHLCERRIEFFKGNYSSFEAQRAAHLDRQRATYATQRKRAAEIERFVARFRAKATKARQVQSRLKQLAKLTVTVPLEREANYRFEFKPPQRMSNPLFAIDEGVCGYQSKTVLRDVTLRIYPGSRIGLLGRNGAGKSTLIKSICGEVDLLAGQRSPGAHCAIGYFAQHTIEGLDLDATPVAHVRKRDRSAREQSIRDFLGGWGFHGDAATEPVRHLSGGEKARLALALIAWERPALLLLDEPTNHLDLDMRTALVLALQNYTGALVIVSHDRHLLRSSVDEFLLVAQGTVTAFDGDLDDYASWLARTEDQKSAPRTALPNARQRRQSAAERRQRTAPLRGEVRRLERHLDELARELGEIEARLAEPDLYGDDGAEVLRQLTIRRGRLQREHTEAEERWLELAERLEADMQA